MLTRLPGFRRTIYGIDTMSAMRGAGGAGGVVRKGPLVLTLALALELTIGRVDAQRPSDSALEELLARARQSIDHLLDELSNVVAEERYVQDSNAFLPVAPIPGLIRGGRGAPPPMSAPAITAKHRELK